MRVNELKKNSKCNLCIGNRMKALGIKDLQYSSCLQILLNLHFGACNLEEFSNISSSLNPNFYINNYSFIMTEKIANTLLLICSAI